MGLHLSPCSSLGSPSLKLLCFIEVSPVPGGGDVHSDLHVTKQGLARDRSLLPLLSWLCPCWYSPGCSWLSLKSGHSYGSCPACACQGPIFLAAEMLQISAAPAWVTAWPIPCQMQDLASVHLKFPKVPLLTHFHSLSRSLWMVALPSRVSTGHLNLVSPANLNSVLYYF